MTRKKTFQTLELLMKRTIEEGECWLWQGYSHNKTPQVSHGGKMMPVRRVFSLLLDKNYPEGGFITVKCGNQMCVNPDHARHYTLKKFSAYRAKKAAESYLGNHMRAVKIQQYKRATSAKLTQEQADAIRISTEPSRVEAVKYGVDKTVICRIRANKSWVNLSAINNPFAALIRKG